MEVLAELQIEGVQVVGIYPTNPWPEVQYIAGHCQAKLAITGDQEQTDKVLEAIVRGVMSGRDEDLDFTGPGRAAAIRAGAKIR